MIACPSCGGNLHFDIPSQRMLCSYCNTQFSPSEVEREKDAEESTYFEATVFSCPQCGGEIYSTDNTVAGFCSFCGASTMLTSRLLREEKPSYVLPFKRTKEQCKESYLKMMRRAIYAPKELKSKKYIKEFRGIYMPYWIYRVTQKGESIVKGEEKHRRGDYIITRHYDVSMDMDTYYDGIAYDASSSFADNISGNIAPFDIKNVKEFSTAYLSGFYADLPDVNAEVYEEDALKFAVNNSKEKLQKLVRQKLVQDDKEMGEALNTKVESRKVTLLPVWFMAYRKKDRVAYATINGQTGKAVADIPVDYRKFLFGSLLGIIPFAFLLELFFTILPTNLLCVVSVLTVLALLLFCSELKQIAIKDGYEDDRGFLAARRERNRKKKLEREQAIREAAAAMGEDYQEPYVVPVKDAEGKDKKKQSKKKMTPLVSKVIIFVILIYIFQPATVIFMEVMDVLGIQAYQAITVIAFIVSLVVGIKSLLHSKKLEGKRNVGAWFGMLSTMIAFFVSVLNPVEDYYYYIAVIVMMVAVLVLLMDLLSGYNMLATRRLPQFDYKGGDDRA